MSVKDLLSVAFQSLHTAEQELMRPAEDAVAFSACQCTKNSACNFFRSYLASRMSDFFQGESLADLQYKCAKIDPQFNTLDISCFNCRNEEADTCDKSYCLSVEKVNECYAKAILIRDLVMKRLELSEKNKP